MCCERVHLVTRSYPQTHSNKSFYLHASLYQFSDTDSSEKYQYLYQSNLLHVHFALIWNMGTSLAVRGRCSHSYLPQMKFNKPYVYDVVARSERTMALHSVKSPTDSDGMVRVTVATMAAVASATVLLTELTMERHCLFIFIICRIVITLLIAINECPQFLH